SQITFTPRSLLSPQANHNRMLKYYEATGKGIWTTLPQPPPVTFHLSKTSRKSRLAHLRKPKWTEFIPSRPPLEFQRDRRNFCQAGHYEPRRRCAHGDAHGRCGPRVVIDF